VKDDEFNNKIGIDFGETAIISFADDELICKQIII
jgi:hypothetical protein